MQPMENQTGADLLTRLVTPQACDPMMEHIVPETQQPHQCGMDPTLEWGECEEEGAEVTMCNELTTIPIPIPLCHTGRGKKKSEVKLGLDYLFMHYCNLDVKVLLSML